MPLAATTGATQRLSLADMGLTGASGGAGAGGVGMKGLVGSALGKAGMGAMTAAIATPLLNQLLGKKMQKTLGSRGKTDVMDALTGAEMGMMFGPEGMAVGALLGTLYGEPRPSRNRRAYRHSRVGFSSPRECPPV